MKSIVVLTLSGCGVCADFKDLLRVGDIRYNEIDANVHASMSDKLEALLNIYNYPIVVLSNQSSDLTYCYTTAEIDLLGYRSLPTGDTAYGFLTLSELFNYIKQY